MAHVSNKEINRHVWHVKRGSSAHLKSLYISLSGCICKAMNRYDIPGVTKEEKEQYAMTYLWEAAKDYRANKGDFPSFAKVVLDRRFIVLLRYTLRERDSVNRVKFHVSLNCPLQAGMHEDETIKRLFSSTYNSSISNPYTTEDMPVEDSDPFRTILDYLDSNSLVPEEEVDYRRFEKRVLFEIKGFSTKMEWKVLKLLMAKYSYKQISKITGYSKKSIDNAAYRIRKKYKEYMRIMTKYKKEEMYERSK